MKKLLLLLTILSITGCSLEELWHEDRSVTSKAFSVEQAQEFFEKDYVDRLTKSQDVDTRAGRFRGRIHPGDFTPLWDKAEYSESEGVAAYDVDIIADRKVVAIRSKFGASGSRAERLNVYQKLVVRRDIESGKMSAYVMSLIPDVGCDDRRIPERFRSRGKDKRGFSGIVVYATMDRGALVCVQEYKNGVLRRGVYIPSGQGTYVDRCMKACEIMKGVTLMSKRNIQTRSGEDEWYDDYEDWYDDHPIESDPWWVGNFDEVGFGVYTDNNGHYYLDNDGDGLIDEETIAPGYIEDDGPEDSEGPWQDGNGNGNEGGKTSENGNENGEDTGNTDNLENNPSNNVDPPTVPEEPDHLPNILDLFNVGIHFTKYKDANKNCLDVCKRTMDKMGQTDHGNPTNVVYLVRENDDHTALVHYGEAAQYYSVVTDCINRHLDAGLCIIVGVDHTLNRGINDGTIDHFLLIVGREYNEETRLYEFIYVETGTDYPNNAYRPENRFIFDQTVGMYMDNSAGSSGAKKYTLTELRPNDGDNSGTISQPVNRTFRFFKRIWS